MRPQTIGRALGIGLRVAGRMAGQQLAGAAQAAAAPRPQQVASQGIPGQAVPAQSVGQNGGRTATRPAVPVRKAVVQGVGGFLRPFRRVGSILWLEVTGVFFLLPVIVFAPNLWRMRASWAHGPDHRTFLITILVVGVFLYLGVSSFWRARRK
jgi:hypothetical protein